MADSIKAKLELGDLSQVTTYKAAALQAAASRALRLHCDRLLSPYGITKTQWMVVGAVLDAGEPGMRFGEISRDLDIKPATLTRIVTALEEKQMVVTKNDSRGNAQKIVTIHPTFPQECPEIERILRIGLRKSIYANVTPLEFRVYLKVLYQLSQLPV